MVKKNVIISKWGLTLIASQNRLTLMEIDEIENETSF